MRRFVVITALTALTLPVAPGVHGQGFDADRQFCADGKTDPDAAISACTRQIQSGGLGGAALARAFFNRALPGAAIVNTARRSRITMRPYV